MPPVRERVGLAQPRIGREHRELACGHGLFDLRRPAHQAARVRKTAQQVRVLVHGEDGHPVGGAGAGIVTGTRLSHRVREGSAAGHDDQPVSLRDLFEHAESLLHAVIRQQAPAQLHDRVHRHRASSGPSHEGPGQERGHGHRGRAAGGRRTEAWIQEGEGGQGQPDLFRGRSSQEHALARENGDPRRGRSEPPHHLPYARRDLMHLRLDDALRDRRDLVGGQHLRVRADHAREPGARLVRGAAAAVGRLAGVVALVDLAQPEVGVRGYREVLRGHAAPPSAKGQ